MLKYVNYALVFLTSLFLDRLTKYWIITGFIKPQAVCSFFNIHIAFNRGISWGIGSNMHDWGITILCVFIACLLLYFMYYLKNILHDKILATACMFILSGGVSNFIDRIWYGAVIDFIQFHWHDWYFPTFNIADVSISLGAFFLIYDMFKQQK